MTKKIFIAAAALLMLTACSNTSDTSENTVSDMASESISETETTSETEADTVSETESESNAVAETESNVDSDVYSGTGYTVKVDPEKWIDVIEYKQNIAEAAEEADTGFDYSAEDYYDACDAYWVCAEYADRDYAANINVVSQDLGADADMDAETIGPYMEESYSAIEGYTFLGWEAVDINGSECLKCDIKTEQMGISIRIQQCIFLKGGLQTVFTLTAEEDDFETVLSDFEEIMSTVNLV